MINVIPMTDRELVRLRSQHRRIEIRGYGECEWDGDAWPCWMARLLARVNTDQTRIDELEHEGARLTIELEPLRELVALIGNEPCVVMHSIGLLYPCGECFPCRARSLAHKEEK
jgi:hypothetical protein